MARITRGQAYPVVPGVALTICIKFRDKEVRLGAHCDYQFLKTTFELMDFKTHPPKERLQWKRSDFEEGVADAVKLFDEEACKDGPFFLCVSTHGDENGIKLSDGDFLSHVEIRRILASHNKLRNKAKVILLQSCRGRMCKTSDEYRVSSFSADNASEEDTWANTMILQSCIVTRAAYHSDKDIVTSDQKEAMLKFMEKHSDFAKGRVNAQQASQCYARLWDRLVAILNGMPGANRTKKRWQDCWGEMRSRAKQWAFSNGKPKNIPTGGGAPPDDDKEDNDDESEFATDDPFVNRIMDLLGWHLAFGVGVEDELESYLDHNQTLPQHEHHNPPALPCPSYQEGFDQLMQVLDRQAAATAELQSLLQIFL